MGLVDPCLVVTLVVQLRDPFVRRRGLSVESQVSLVPLHRHFPIHT